KSLSTLNQHKLPAYSKYPCDRSHPAELKTLNFNCFHAVYTSSNMLEHYVKGYRTLFGSLSDTSP
ncbi:hypothetical protein ACTXT7_016918, partial [Hymenolepis weldensis]